MSDDIAQRLAKLEDAFAYHFHPSRPIQTEGPINLAGWKPASNPQFRVTEAPFLVSEQERDKANEALAYLSGRAAAWDRIVVAVIKAGLCRDNESNIETVLRVVQTCRDAEVRCATLVAAIPPRHTCEVPDYSDGYNMCRATIIDRFRAAGVKTIID